MKAALLFFLVFLTTNLCFSQKEIKLEDVSKYVGDTVKVCGQVYSVKYLSDSKGGPTFLNIGASFPEQKLTVVIWRKSRGLFNSPPEEFYNKRDVCITGKVELYKDKPQIVVKEAIQIQLQK